MGVTGLWRLIEPAGKPVPVETLENKVLAVDISIWLHQMVKGYQDAKGAPLPNAHLMGLFQRVCKLLYFRIKPVFVFDGGFPDLKKETIAKRQDNKTKYNSESERLKRELALILSKKTAVSSLLGKQISPKKGSSAADASNDDIFKLPALPQREETESESEDDQDSSGSIVDLHSVDVESDDFKSLPVKEKYELLVDLKETRKLNSWGRLHELPKQSNHFSDFQMQRLLKRRKVQECLEETEKEMGDTGMSLNDLESLLNEEGIETKIDSLPTRRIASNNSTRFLLISNVKQALADAKKKKEAENKAGPSKIVYHKNENTRGDDEIKSGKRDELEDDLEKAIKMSLNTDEVIDAPEEKEVGKDLKKTIKMMLATDDEMRPPKNEELEEDLAKAIKMSLATDGVIEQPKEKELENDFKKAIKISLATAHVVQPPKKNEQEDDLEEAIKMSLECVNETDTSACNSKTDDSWTSVKTDSDCADSEDEDGYEQPDLTTAKAYIMQYSDFTHTAIANLVAKKTGSKKGKTKVPKVDQIIDELYREKSIIVDNINLSSSDDDNNIQDGADFCTKISNKQNSVVESNTSEIIENMDMTQSSVICVENPTQNIISLDTSTEEEENRREDANPSPSVKSDKAFSESDDEFVDVPEVEKKPATTVCEIMLTMDNPPEDDIFADIFAHKKEHATTEVNVTKDTIHGNVSQTCEPKTTTTLKLIKVNENASTSKQYQAEIKENSTIKVDFITEDLHLNKQNLLNKEVRKESVNKVKLNKSYFDNADVIEIARNTVHIENIESKPECSFDKPKVTFDHTETNENARERVENQIIDNNDKIDKLPTEVISSEQLNTMVEELQHEEQDLLQEKGRLDRIGRNITEQMTKEAQELLQIFGIPYIVAPTEAEAQCAFLESINLTDGTITDDSDIWLFGGRTVYKNFFNQKKHVLQFLAERIERSFNLTREQLVLLALLVGSDYTTGVSGVGPVTALEILASFPFNKKQCLKEASKQARYTQIVGGLHEFKKWVRAGKRTDNTTLKKKLKNVNLTDDFPSVRVVQAYLEPNVEKSEEKFTWGEMDITVLRDYTKAKFGWSQNKLDEIIKPVLKRILDRKAQRSVQDYFKKKIEFQSLEEQMSKRVKAAVQKMGPEQLSKEQNITPEEQAKTVKRKGNKNKKDAPQTSTARAGPKPKKMKNSDDIVLNDLGVKVMSETKDGKSSIEIKIPKSDRVQEIIPQREKDKQSLLQNKMKAIEIFRKTKMDGKRKTIKKRVNLPKERAELSESSDSN